MKRSRVKKILVVSLTNIGDVILTLPVVDILRRDFPQAAISISIGPKAESLFRGNPYFSKVHIYDKKQSALKTMRWMLELRREDFDLVVDLRNSAIPFLVAPRYRTPVAGITRRAGHMREKHLDRLRTVYPFEALPENGGALFISREDQAYVQGLIKNEVGAGGAFVVIAPGAAHRKKRWPAAFFASLAQKLKETYSVRIVLVGDTADRDVVRDIATGISPAGVDLAGRTTLVQLAALMKEAALVISNDSAPMHLSSYLNKPTLAFFGPSDPAKYGPWSKEACYLQRNISRPDEWPDVSDISVDEAFGAICFDGEKFSLRITD